MHLAVGGSATRAASGLAAATSAPLAAIPNVTLLEAPWANRDAETDVAGGAPVGPYPETVDGYALPLNGSVRDF